MNTETRNPKSSHLDKMSAIEIVRLVNDEDRIILEAVKLVEEKIALLIEKVATAFKAGGRIIYIGAGTSGRIAEMDCAEMLPTFSVEPGRFIAIQAYVSDDHSSLFMSAEDDHRSAILELNNLGVNRKDVVIGLAASGRTPFVLSAIRHAKQKGIWTCGISNSTNSLLLDEADHSILIDTGPEILTGSTRLKAGTSQKMVLNVVSTGAMVLCGKVIQNLMVDVQPRNSKLKERCVRIIRELTTVTEDEARSILEQNQWNIREVLNQLGISSNVS